MLRPPASSPLRLRALLLLGLVLAAAAPAGATLLRPLEGAGNFLSTIDVVERPENDGTLSLILLISVANRDLTFRTGHGYLQGELGVSVRLDPDSGAGASLETEVELRCAGREEAASATVYQILPLVLEGVTARSGRLTVVLKDHNRERPGLLSRLRKDNWARSEAVGDWAAATPAAGGRGLTLHDPVFLARAPIAIWAERGMGRLAPERSALTDHLHPNRRYGLEQKSLQVYFEVEPGADRGAGARDGLYLQVLAKDLDVALRDTIRFAGDQLARLAGGGSTGVFYDLNLKDLPPGSYQLSAAPLEGHGRPWLAEFDVIWSTASLNRFADELLGEGRTVLYGDRLDAFEAAGQAEREAILEKFWAERDPDPSTPANETYQEFRRRVSYVREYLGGFGTIGAIDPRGTVYLLLGPPNDISRQVLPLNEDDQEDALVQVFDGFAPEREGTQIRSNAGIPLEQTHQSRRAIADKRRSIGFNKGFELWEYDHDGHQLFPNRYSGQNLGLRFLFVDRFGTGSWVLESSNAVNVGS